MAERNPGRVAVVVLSLVAHLVAMVFNTLASIGGPSGIFKQSTEDVTQKYVTDITPARWSLFVWDFTYVWLLCMHIYLLTGLFRRSASSWMYAYPAVLPYAFHVILITNIIMNVSYLFLFDRELLLASLVMSATMAFTNCLLMFFSCYGLKVYGAWLNKHHSLDLWLLRILVQNGVAMYTTFTSVATLLKLTIVLNYNLMSSSNSAIISLSLLLAGILIWFVVENFLLENHLRYILSVYPVVILVLAGIVSHSSQFGLNDIVSAALLGVTCILLIIRIALVVWRHYHHPLYRPDMPVMSPMELVRTQNRVFF
ncbi:uncharacterized protein LOC105889269 [Clupea harengus]|uniref:Uncharacterized protein LOC105889269 n=1 Tax=Clupea harengus TaxID=7950 RepID=A0A6P3VG31_CLUHA|nr:uncharacterized protein LOC105889269 [Clupea harengus]XP_042566282.1 uncharacterized protein LOC105889269 [Clupea harengus]